MRELIISPQGNPPPSPPPAPAPPPNPPPAPPRPAQNQTPLSTQMLLVHYITLPTKIKFVKHSEELVKIIALSFSSFATSNISKVHIIQTHTITQKKYLSELKTPIFLLNCVILQNPK